MSKVADTKTVPINAFDIVDQTVAIVNTNFTDAYQKHKIQTPHARKVEEKSVSLASELSEFDEHLKNILRDSDALGILIDNMVPIDSRIRAYKVEYGKVLNIFTSSVEKFEFRLANSIKFLKQFNNAMIAIELLGNQFIHKRLKQTGNYSKAIGELENDSDYSSLVMMYVQSYAAFNSYFDQFMYVLSEIKRLLGVMSDVMTQIVRITKESLQNSRSIINYPQENVKIMMEIEKQVKANMISVNLIDAKIETVKEAHRKLIKRESTYRHKSNMFGINVHTAFIRYGTPIETLANYHKYLGLLTDHINNLIRVKQIHDSNQEEIKKLQNSLWEDEEIKKYLVLTDGSSRILLTKLKSLESELMAIIRTAGRNRSKGVELLKKLGNGEEKDTVKIKAVLKEMLGEHSNYSYLIDVVDGELRKIKEGLLKPQKLPENVKVKIVAILGGIETAITSARLNIDESWRRLPFTGDIQRELNKLKFEVAEMDGGSDINKYDKKMKEMSEIYGGGSDSIPKYLELANAEIMTDHLIRDCLKQMRIVITENKGTINADVQTGITFALDRINYLTDVPNASVPVMRNLFRFINMIHQYLPTHLQFIGQLGQLTQQNVTDIIANNNVNVAGLNNPATTRLFNGVNGYTIQSMVMVMACINSLNHDLIMFHLIYIMRENMKLSRNENINKLTAYIKNILRITYSELKSDEFETKWNTLSNDDWYYLIHAIRSLEAMEINNINIDMQNILNNTLGKVVDNLIEKLVKVLTDQNNNPHLLHKTINDVIEYKTSLEHDKYVLDNCSFKSQHKTNIVSIYSSVIKKTILQKTPTEVNETKNTCLLEQQEIPNMVQYRGFVSNIWNNSINDDINRKIFGFVDTCIKSINLCVQEINNNINNMLPNEASIQKLSSVFDSMLKTKWEHESFDMLYMYMVYYQLCDVLRTPGYVMKAWN